MEKKPPDATPKKADPKISKDELPEDDLNKVTGGATGDGKVTHGDLPFVKITDKATPQLF
jgi:type VI protein secretion system component Hcp